MTVVGLAGKYCAGKNRICAIFEEAGFRPIDVDRLGHEALEVPDVRARIADAFGSAVFLPDGKVDRKALGALVFSDPAKLSALESIVHPWMTERTRELIGRYGDKVIVNAAILHRMGLHAYCDAVVWVEAPLCERIRRGLRRDGLSLYAVLRRIWSQRALTPQPFRDTVDTYTVRNARGGGERGGQGAGFVACLAWPLPPRA